MLALTGEQILDFVGNSNPTQADTDWANAVAAAVISGVNVRLNGAIVDPSPDDELNVACLLAGAEAYKRKEATFGSAGYADLEGNAIAITRDYLEAIKPLIDRYGAGPGIG